ncbi:MAG TPA: hypothetical protein PK961_18005 [bacterium]|nr:hypothetical protein [bacterium]
MWHAIAKCIRSSLVLVLLLGVFQAAPAAEKATEAKPKAGPRAKARAKAKADLQVIPKVTKDQVICFALYTVHNHIVGHDGGSSLPRAARRNGGLRGPDPAGSIWDFDIWICFDFHAPFGAGLRSARVSDPSVRRGSPTPPKPPTEGLQFGFRPPFGAGLRPRRNRRPKVSNSGSAPYAIPFGVLIFGSWLCFGFRASHFEFPRYGFFFAALRCFA